MLGSRKILRTCLETKLIIVNHSQRGYGTWQSKPGEVEEGVFQALKAGYRHLVRLILRVDHSVIANIV